jgi:uncharacterized membrane protein YfcA
MEIALIIGLFLALFVGLTMGLMGGGGSILTVPILVYIINIEPDLATGYSLFIVGSTAVIGTYNYYRQRLISFQTAIFFAIPSFFVIFLTRSYIMPAIPDPIFQISSFIFSKKMLIMLVFALLMIAASLAMIRKKIASESAEKTIKVAINYPVIVLTGATIGLLTGFVGAGGGFLIVPALVFFAHLPMKKAVGTSLSIVAANSLIGFIGDVQQQGDRMDWRLLLAFTTIAIIGIFIGMAAAKKIAGDKLKPAFGWFVLIMGVYILIKEGFFS